LAEVEDADDVLVLELRRGRGLADEARARLVGHLAAGLEDLERDRDPALLVEGVVHDAHRALAERALDVVARDFDARRAAPAQDAAAVLDDEVELGRGDRLLAERARLRRTRGDGRRRGGRRTVGLGRGP